MTMLLNEKTKQEKIINEVQKKRNLFGLGLTSLIAACGATDSATDDAVEVGIGTRPTTDLQSATLAEEVGSDTLRAKAVAPGSDGGLDGRSNLNDMRVVVFPEKRGLAENDSKGTLIFRIANGNYIQNQHATSINKFGGDEYNLIISSDRFGDVDGSNITGAMYIFWDIKDKTASDVGGTTTTILDENGLIAEVRNEGDAATTLTQKHLKVAGVTGDTISNAIPTFYKDLGGEADQTDMLLQSSSNLNIIWDFTKHATTDVEGGTELILGDSPGILQVQGAFSGLHFIKINNNNNYDMTMKDSGNVYILWDVINYYDANATVATDPVSLNDLTTATHGLLTIANTSLLFSSIVYGSFTDINEGGINDLIFKNAYSKTYILFGEKVANRDKYGKAISHSIDLDKVDTDNEFYDKDGVAVDEPTGGAAKAGFFHYDLDGNDVIDDVEKNVGYRLIGGGEGILDNVNRITKAYEAAINPPPAEAPTGGALSEEAYWDIA